MDRGTELMIFHITITPEEITAMESPEGRVTFIPFGGCVESALFTGEIRPGAADVQVTNAAGIRHMEAKYIFKGTDGNGTPCCLFVDNNGWFEPGSDPGIFHAWPVMMSDSEWLSERVSGNHFRAEGHPAEGGVDIHIFDVLK